MSTFKAAKLAAGMAIALSLALGAFAQPMMGSGTPGVQVPDKLPELLKAIAAELTALWDKVQEIPALKEALTKPMELAKGALGSLKEIGKPNKEALKQLVILSLALHRIEDVFEHGVAQRVREHMGNFRGMAPKGGPKGVAPAGPGRGPKGRGPAAAGKLAEVREWIEAYLRGAMSALSPEEAAKFRGIVQGLIQGLREEFAPKGPERRGPAPEALELGRHVLRIKALSSKLDLFLIRAISATEAPTG